jgi:RNA polymerase sigma-70 factor, ECF subfamily
MRDASAAEDVVHDCYCRLLARADVYDLPRDGTKLLYRSIANACINRFQRQRRMVSLDVSDGDGQPISASIAPTYLELPEGAMMRSELEQAIEQGMERLSPMQRAALQLRILDHSTQEIADMLGLTVTNAGVLIHRARQTLAVVLAPHLGGKIE